MSWMVDDEMLYTAPVLSTPDWRVCRTHRQWVCLCTCTLLLVAGWAVVPWLSCKEWELLFLVSVIVLDGGRLLTLLLYLYTESACMADCRLSLFCIFLFLSSRLSRLRRHPSSFSVVQRFRDSVRASGWCFKKCSTQTFESTDMWWILWMISPRTRRQRQRIP